MESHFVDFGGVFSSELQSDCGNKSDVAREFEDILRGVMVGYGMRDELTVDSLRHAFNPHSSRHDICNATILG